MSEDKLPLWCTRPYWTNAALSLQIVEVLLSSTSWRSNETKCGEAWGEEKIQSNSAGVTFSHNPPQMLLVSGDSAAEGWWEERWEAFLIILWCEKLKVVTFGLGGTFPHPTLQMSL